MGGDVICSALAAVERAVKARKERADDLRADDSVDDEPPNDSGTVEAVDAAAASLVGGGGGGGGGDDDDGDDFEVDAEVECIAHNAPNPTATQRRLSLAGTAGKFLRAPLAPRRRVPTTPRAASILARLWSTRPCSRQRRVARRPPR
jgi:hypothetical protein